jgi:hypothetical protein
MPLSMESEATSERRRRLLQVIAQMGLFLAYVAATLVFLWPLLRHFSSALPTTPYWWDAFHNLFAGDTSRQNLLTAGRHRFDSLAFYPHPHSLIFSEHLVLLGLLFGPVEWALGRPAAYNTVLVLLIAASGWAMHRLARRLGCQFWAAALAGLVFAFSPIHLFHLARANVLGGFFLPFGWQALLDWWERPSARRALWLGTCLALPAFCSLYSAAFLAVTSLTFSAVYLLTRRPVSFPFKRWVVLWAALPPLLLAAWYNSPYLTLRQGQALGRRVEELQAYAGTPKNLVSADPLSRIWGSRLPDAERFEGSSSFVGVAAWAIFLLGLAGADASRPWRAGLRVIALRVALFVVGVAAAVFSGSWIAIVPVWLGGGWLTARLRSRLGRPAVTPVAAAFEATAIVCLLFFLGPTAQLADAWPSFSGPWGTLTAYVPGLDAIRALRRFATPFLAAALALGGPALSTLVERAGRARLALVGALFVTVTLDLWTKPIPLIVYTDPCHDPLWQALATHRDAKPVFVLPFEFHAEGALVQEATRCHGHPTTNGALSYFPADLKRLRELAAAVAEPAVCAELFTQLRAMRVGYVAITARGLGPPPPKAGQCALREGAKLIFHDQCSVLLELPKDRPAMATATLQRLGVDLHAAYHTCPRPDPPLH